MDLMLQSSPPWTGGPKVGVAAVVIHADAVLLIRRAKPPQAGEWSLPGGSQQAGETVAEAAARELREETGVTARMGPVVGVFDLIERDAHGTLLWHYTLIDVAGVWLSGTPMPADDATAAAWVPLDDLDRLDLWPPVREAIARARTSAGLG